MLQLYYTIYNNIKIVARFRIHFIQDALYHRSMTFMVLDLASSEYFWFFRVAAGNTMDKSSSAAYISGQVPTAPRCEKLGGQYQPTDL